MKTATNIQLYEAWENVLDDSRASDSHDSLPYWQLEKN